MHIVDFFKKILTFKSITPNDDGLLTYISEFMYDFNSVFIEKNGVKNLILSKEFGKGEHFAFGGHIDVVPPGNGWDSDPFIPRCEGDLIYARGSSDMKSGVAAFLYAAKNLKSFPGKISILITSDEEGDGIFGTLEMLKFLKEKNDLPKYAIVAEPTCDVFFGDTIKIGRRGSINGLIKINGKQGHVAYPQKCINPIHQLADIIHKFAGVDLDNGDEFFDPSKLIITDIRGGIQVNNVTANDVKIMFNVRNSTQINTRHIELFFKNLLNNLDYELEIKQSSKPFISQKNSKILKFLKQSINNIISVTPNINCKGGTSDARYFAEFGVDVIEFGVCNKTIHSINENIDVKDLENLYKIFLHFLENYN